MKNSIYRQDNVSSESAHIDCLSGLVARSSFWQTSLAALLALLGASSQSTLADLYWRTDGNSTQTWTSTSWSDPASTTGGTGWTSGSDAIFTANSTAASAATSIGNVTISDGRSVTVSAGTGGITLPQSSTYTVGTGATLTWLGAISGGSTSNINLAIGGSGNTTLSGLISDGIAGGRLGLVKDGTGTLVLGGSPANTFTGGIQINSGIFRLTATSQALGSNTITLGSATGGDARFEVSTGTSPTYNLFTVNQGTGNRTLAMVSDNTANLNWRVILEKDLTITSNQATKGINLYSEIIGGSNLIFTYTGAGTPSHSIRNPSYSGGDIFTTRNLFTGNLIITNGAFLEFGTNPTNLSSATVDISAGGTFRLRESSLIAGLNGAVTGNVVATQNSKTLTIAGNGNYVFSGSLLTGANTGAGLTIRMNKEGLQGTQTLAGNNTFAGTTALEAGTLRLDYSAANGSKLSDSGILTLRGINLDLSGGSHTEVVASTTLTTGFNTISRSSGSSVLALGALTNSSGGINFSAGNIATTTLANTNNILGGKAVFTVAGQDWARNDGSNNIVAFSAGNYTAMSSTVNLTTNNFNHYLAAGNVTVDAGNNLYVGTIKIDPSGANQSFKTTNLAQNLNFGNGTGGAGGILYTGSQNYSFLADGNGIIWNETNIFNYSSGNLTLGRFNHSLRFFGNGTTILAQNSSSNSTMYIYGGTVRFSSNNPTSSGNYELFGGTLLADTSGGDISLVRGNGTSRTIALGYNAPRIDVVGGNTLTIDGVISSSNSIFSPVVFGSSTSNGTIVLGGTNTFFGDLRLEGGTLSVTSDAQLGDVGNMLVFGGNATFKTTGSFTANRAVAINTGYTGTFAPDTGTTFTLSHPIRGAGNLHMNGAGTLILSGSSLYTGLTQISQGTLSLTSVNATAKSSGIQISGGAGLTYSGGAATLGQNITVTSGSGILRNSGGGLLTLNGSISKNGTILRLSQGSFLVNGAITGSAANSDIYLESGSAITFTGSNSYNGPTYILNGTTLNANSAGALPGTTDLLMDNTGSGSSVLNLGANQSIGSISGNTSSAINLGASSLTTTSASSTTFAGAISGSGGLTKAGAGTLTLSGSNSYNGSTAITAGTLSLGSGSAAGGLGSGNISISSGAALVANRSNDLTLANAISGAGDVLQSGSGNTTLSGVNTNTGAVRATAGQLKFDGANALSSSISALQVNNATLSLADGTARTTNLASASLTSTSATFVFDISTSAADMLLLGGSATLVGNNTVNLNFLNTITSGQSWVLLNATGGGLAGSWTLGTTSGTGQSGFTFSLSATSNALTLTAATSSSTFYWKGELDNVWGTTSGSDSNWASDVSGAPVRSSPPDAGSDVVFAATGAGNLSTTLGADRTINSLTISQGGVQINGANTLTMQSTAASGILVNAASGTVTIGANLAGTSTGLTKEGASFLVLSGNNSYGGGTLLSGGTLRIGSDAALGNSSAAITMSGDAVLQASSDFTLGASRPIAMSGNGVLDTQSHTVTLNGTLGGLGTLQKTGAGTLVLNNANSITGAVSPAAGTLVLANQNALSSATLAMAGGNLSFSSSVGGDAFTLGGLSAASTGAGYDIQLQNTAGQAIALTAGSNNASTTYAAALSGNGSFTKAGAGALTLSGNNTYTGATTVNAGTLAVTGSLSATPAITINGGTLSLDSTNAVAATTTITLANAAGTAFNISANQTIGGLRGGGTSGGTTAIASGRTLVVQESGTHSYNGTITGDGRFRFNGTGGLTLGGQVSNTDGVTISSGTLTLAAANTYLGGTTLQGGMLNINNASALSSGAFTIAGGTLGNTSGTDITLGANVQLWNGDFGYTSLPDRTLNLGTGVVTLGANRTVTIQSGTLTVAGGISGSNLGITKAGNGTLRLQGINSFTGGVAIDEGTLVVSGGSAIADSVVVTIANTAGATLSVISNEAIGSLRGGGANSGGVIIGSNLQFSVTETGNQTFAGPLSGSGTFIKQGSGTINLTSNSSTLSGPIDIRAGAIAVSTIGNTGFSSALGTNATILIGNSQAQSIGTLRWEGVGSETTNKNISTGNNDLTNPNLGPNLFAVNSGAILTITGNISSTSAALKTLTLNGSGGSIIVSGTVSDGTGPMKALITGTGNATHGFLNANNSFTGGVTIQSNTANNSVGLRVTTIGNSGSNSSLGTNGTINIGGNATGSTSTLVYAGTGETSNKVLNLQGTVGNVALEQAGTGNLKFTTNITVTGAGAKQLILQGSTAGTGEIAGVIVDSASGATTLVKNGTGTWILSGANTYTGSTTLNAGTLRLDHTGAAGPGTLTQSSGASLLHLNAAGTFANAMSVYNVRASETLSLSGGITVNNATFDVDNGDTLTISGGIGGSGGVTKNGTGTLALSGSNTYTGATIVNSGTLQATSAGALSSTSSVVINNSGSLLVTADTINDSASVNLSGGTLALNGTFNETVGALTLSANSVIDLNGFTGTLRFGSLASFAAGATLSIWNWNGINQYGTPVGNGLSNRHIVFTNATGLSSSLSYISFYSGSGTGFSGTGFEEGFSGGGTEIGAVPEPETWATAFLLLIGSGFWIWKQRKQRTSIFSRFQGREGVSASQRHCLPSTESRV